jgi:hypothetical protein
MVIAGLIHLALAPLHWGHAPAHGLIFALSGIAEIVWGIAFWRKPSPALRHTGVILAGGLITLWAITRLLPAPFGDEPGEVELIGLFSKLAEGISFATLIALAISSTITQERKKSGWRMVGESLALSLIAGWLFYLMALAVAPMLPWLGEQTDHSEVEVVSVISQPSTLPAPVQVVGKPPLLTDDLQLVVAGVASPFANGDEIPVVGDVMAQLTFTPGDERYGRDLDLHLYQLGNSMPIDDATVQVTGRMRYMDHGTFRQTALYLEEGHYLLPLQFIMPGEWGLELEITAAGGQNTIYLDLNLLE